MNSLTYFQNVRRTESPNCHAVPVRILHAAIGIGTESGEFLDAVKKAMFYGRELDKKNLKEELGDLLWYIGIAADELGTTFEQLMDENIAKLKARYPDQFTQEAEQGRDYQKEAEAVKQALTEGAMDALLYGRGVVEVKIDVDKPVASVCPLSVNTVPDEDIIAFLEQSTSAPANWPDNVKKVALDIESYCVANNKQLFEFEYSDTKWVSIDTIQYCSGPYIRFNELPHRLKYGVWPVKEERNPEK